MATGELNLKTTDINTVIAFMEKAGEALAYRDMDAVRVLQEVVSNWVQTESERAAQRHLLQTITDAIEHMEELETADDPMDDFNYVGSRHHY